MKQLITTRIYSFCKFNCKNSKDSISLKKNIRVLYTYYVHTFYENIFIRSEWLSWLRLEYQTLLGI